MSELADSTAMTTDSTAPIVPTSDESKSEPAADTQDFLQMLSERIAELRDPLDLPGEWTQRERNKYVEKRQLLIDAHAQLKDANHRFDMALAKLAGTTSEIRRMHKWKEFLLKSRETMCDELLTISDSNDRSDAVRRGNLEVSIRTIDSGPTRLYANEPYTMKGLRIAELMDAAGYTPRPGYTKYDIYRGSYPWQGSLSQIEHEIVLYDREEVSEARHLVSCGPVWIRKACDLGLRALREVSDLT